MGLGADTVRFRYQFRSSAGGTAVRQALVDASVFTTSLVLNGVANVQPGVVTSVNVMRMVLPPADRGGLVGPCARVVYVRFTGALPVGLVTARRAVVVLSVAPYESYQVGQIGTFRGLPVEVVAKRDGRPSVSGGF